VGLHIPPCDKKAVLTCSCTAAASIQHLVAHFAHCWYSNSLLCDGVAEMRMYKPAHTARLESSKEATDDSSDSL
jgi:hypothetical protein